jgi:hypothetical protein
MTVVPVPSVNAR